MAWSDIVITVTGTNGDTVTLSASNPTGQSETARASVTVSLDSGGTETLVSPNFTLAAGATRTISLRASAPIGSISDGPDPMPPI